MQGTKFDDEIVHTAPSTTPWGTHAYIIEAETAERLLLLGNHFIERARRHASKRASSWQLDGHDIKIDHFIKNYYDDLLPRRHRSKYASCKSVIQRQATMPPVMMPEDAVQYGRTDQRTSRMVL